MRSEASSAVTNLRFVTAALSTIKCDPQVFITIKYDLRPLAQTTFGPRGDLSGREIVRTLLLSELCSDSGCEAKLRYGP